MNSRVKKMYENRYLQQLPGLPEVLVQFEAQTGKYIPDNCHMKFVKATENEQTTIVTAKIGDFFVVAQEKQGEVSYATYEDEFHFRLWINKVVDDAKNRIEHMGYEETYKQKVQKIAEQNIISFLNNVNQLFEEE